MIEQVESEILLILQDEANALRYAAGYVPFALKKRFFQEARNCGVSIISG